MAFLKLKKISAPYLSILIFGLGLITAGASVKADVVLLENFINLESGSIVEQSGIWYGSTAALIEQELGNAGNQILNHRLSAGQRDLYRTLAGAATVGQTETKTLFFRFRCENQYVDTGIGLTDVNAPSGWDDFRIQIQINGGQFGVRHGAETLFTQPLQMGAHAGVAWYNVWVVINNNTDTYKAYLLQSNDEVVSATEVDRIVSGAIDTFNFRSSTTNSLTRFYTRANTNNRLWIDEIYMMDGEQLDNPISLPSSRLWTDEIAAAQPGDVVELEAGTYILEDTFLINKPMTIIGQGKEQTILRADDNLAGDMIQIRNTSNVRLANLTLDGNHNTALSAAVQLSNGTGYVVENLKIHNLTGTGNSEVGPYAVRGSAITHSVFRNNEMLNIGVDSTWSAGIRLRNGSSHNLIDGNFISHVGRGGIFTNDGSTNTRIINNTVHNVSPSYPAFGIEVWGTAQGKADGKNTNVIIEDNTVDVWISVDNQINTAVRRNSITGPPQIGFIGFCGLEMVSSRAVVMTDNYVDGRHHIGLTTSSSGAEELLYFAHNTIRNAETWGTQIQGDTGGAHKMYFHQNVFELTKKTNDSWYPSQAGHGFRFNNNAFGIVFNDNQFRNNAGAGIQLLGNNLDHFVVINNTISNNSARSLEGSFPGDNLYAAGNIVYGNGSHSSHNQTLHNQTKGDPYSVPVGAAIVTSGSYVAGQTMSLELAGFEGAAISDVLWDMGQGYPLVGGQVEHVYDSAGFFQVAAVVWLDNSGYGVLVKKTLTITEPGLPGDLNNDGVVDLVDFSLFSQQWMTNGNVEPSADLSGDGWVGMDDLYLFIDAWLED